MSGNKISRRRVRAFAQEMHERAEELAPGGKGTPNACGTADELIGWAKLLEELAAPKRAER